MFLTESAGCDAVDFLMNSKLVMNSIATTRISAPWFQKCGSSTLLDRAVIFIGSESCNTSLHLSTQGSNLAIYSSYCLEWQSQQTLVSPVTLQDEGSA